jgi:hypothetical protein
VAGELLGQLGAEGVGGEVRRAPPERRRAGPVVVQVRPRRADLRLIDSIIAASATPYSALHDIDANKPGGSIKIRVKTYAHSLKLHEERLEDTAHRKDELKFRMEEKRLSLLELKRQQLEARKQQDPALEAMINETKVKVASTRRRSKPTSRRSTPSIRPRTRAWCGSESRSASTTAKSWRAFNRRQSSGNCRHQAAEEPYEASDPRARTPTSTSTWTPS